MNPKIKNTLPDPDILAPIKKATDKLFEIIEKKKKIGIFGDYDVDGSTSTALICRYFEEIGGI